jgi:hypothetical protein
VNIKCLSCLHKKETNTKNHQDQTITNGKCRKLNYAGSKTVVLMYTVTMGEKWNAYRILVGNPEGKRPLGRPRRRWVDNIKMELREIV